MAARLRTAGGSRIAIFTPRFLRQLRDVLIGTPADNDVLTYDTADGKWKPAAGGGGSGDIADAVILAPAASARNVIQPTAGTVIAAIVKAHAAQSVDLTQWQTSAGVVMGSVGKTGSVLIRPSAVDGYTSALNVQGPNGLLAMLALFATWNGESLSIDNAGRFRIQNAAAANVFDVQPLDSKLAFFNAALVAQQSASTIADLWTAVKNYGLLTSGSTAPTTFAPSAHKTSHEDGGADEISVAGLSGLLADGQTPLSHAHSGADITSGTVADARIDAAIARDSEVTSAVAAEATARDAAIAVHVTDTSDAHDASAVSFSPTGTIAATDVQAAIAEVASEAGGISATLFDANTILKADTDDTPAALTMGASTILARLAAGSITAATPAELRTLLDVPTNAEAILDALVDAKGDLLTATAADTPARLAVGTNGHVLTADSAQSTGIKWAAAAGGGVAYPRKYKTGLYYQTNQDPAGDGANTPVKDRVEYHAFPVGEALTVDRITLGVVTAGAASSVVRLGFYNDTDGMPDALLLDAGTINGTSNTYQEITISQALSAGTLYWVAVVWQVGAVGVLRGTAVASGASWVGHSSNIQDPRACAYFQASVTGALPANATPTATGVGNTAPASVKVRAT